MARLIDIWSSWALEKTATDHEAVSASLFQLGIKYSSPETGNDRSLKTIPGLSPIWMRSML